MWGCISDIYMYKLNGMSLLLQGLRIIIVGEYVEVKTAHGSIFYI